MLKHNDDIDPYSTAIVEDLLQSQQDWKNVNDIIRLSFKALTEVVKSQGESIREIEKQISTRASKSEMHSGLALKANINDISRTIAEIASNLDSKISYEAQQTLLKDYAMKADMQYLLSKQESIQYKFSKLDVDEVKEIIEKQSGVEFKSEINQLRHKIEELAQQSTKKFNQTPTLKDFSQLSAALELKANLQEMTEALETKASKHQVQQAVNKKISKQELDQYLQNYVSLEDFQPVIQSLDQKASLEQIDKIAAILEVKVDRQDFSILINSLQNKVELHQYELLKEQLSELQLQFEQKEKDNQMNELKQQIDQINKITQKKADVHQVSQFQGDLDILSQRINKNQQELFQELGRLKNELLESKQFTSEQMQTTVMKSNHISEKLSEELYNLSENIKQMEEERQLELEDIKKAIQRFRRDQQSLSEQIEESKQEPIKYQQKQHNQLQKEINELKAKILSYDDEQQIYNQIEQQLQKKVNEIKRTSNQGSSSQELKSVKSEVAAIVSKKLQQFENQFNQLENNIKQRVLYQDFEELKNIIQKLCIDQDERAYQKDLQKHIQLTKYTLDLVQKDVLMKSNIQDVCTLLESKANIPDINNALEMIHKEMQTKLSSDDLTEYLKQQNNITESLCQENIIARFQWRSGELQNHLIPWEYEVINTLPENFVWEKGKTSILVVAPGVYNLNYGFFAREKQSVQIIINGEQIHSQEQKKRVSDYQGLTLQEYIVLPNRARIQISYTGNKAEGFLSLKRL